MGVLFFFLRMPLVKANIFYNIPKVGGSCHGGALFRIGKALINGRQKVLGVGITEQDGCCQSLGQAAENI